MKVPVLIASVFQLLKETRKGNFLKGVTYDGFFPVTMIYLCQMHLALAKNDGIYISWKRNYVRSRLLVFRKG